MRYTTALILAMSGVTAFAWFIYAIINGMQELALITAALTIVLLMSPALVLKSN